MCRVLILDDDKRFAESLKPVVDNFEDNGTTTSELASTLDEALVLAKAAVQAGQPYTVFLVDQRLGAGKDGIEAMGELRKVSPNSSAIIFTGIEDPEVGIRAYRAGAFRYLTKPIEVEELTFVLNALMRSRREEVENKWRKIFSEMMETALHHSNFSDVAKVVVNYSMQLGFKRVHLFWAPKQSDSTERNIFVGIECAGDGCISSFSEIKFCLPEKKELRKILRSRDAAFIHEHDISQEFKGEIESIGFQYPTGGWWILPLWSGQELLGTLTLDFGETHGYLSEHERTLLDFFARQVSVTLEHAGLYNREKRTSEEMKLLQRASVEMLRIAHQSEDAFWLTVLTIATANFGLGFNRALLFLTKDNHRILYGRAGVGDNDSEGARRVWEQDEERQYGFDSFLEDVISKRIQTTPLHKFIIGKEISTREFGNKIRDILEIGEMIELSVKEASTQLPDSITNGFTPAECALLPVRAGIKILGLVIVDNKHNQKPLNRNSLGNLQTLLANAGLVWETLHQRAKSEELLDANYEILGGAGYQPLQETLDLICKTARNFSEANWAIIYPIRKVGISPFYEFEHEQFGHDGILKAPINLSVEQPDVGGVSMHVLHKGELIVNDMDIESPTLGNKKLSENHFIQREEVKALAGIAIKDPYTREPLGILYLDYLQSHLFSEIEIRHANSFARLAAVAISNARRNDEQRHRELLKTALEISEKIGTELNIEEIMANVLEKLQIRFKNTALCILLYDEDEKALKFAPQTLQYYKIVNPELQSIRNFPVNEKNNGSIACKAARKALATHHQEYFHAPDVKSDPDYLPLNPKTSSELCVSLMSGNGKLLGVLALEREGNIFDKDDIALVETVAHQLGQAIERSQRSEQLAFKSTVATMTAWASDIAHDINSEVGRIRGNAYLIKQMSEEQKIADYADEIDESAKTLSSVGPWSSQAKKEIPLDLSLQGFLEQIVVQRNVYLETNLQAPDVYIKVNPNEFQHVLRHLTRNAARAMEHFDGTKEKKISVSTRHLQDGEAEILFQDYGPGIDDRVRAAIFQRRASTKLSAGGYGLLIARQLVDDMGGKITLLPAEAGKGAIFSIKLPIIDKVIDIE
jgi:GAF domain-containing protein